MKRLIIFASLLVVLVSLVALALLPPAMDQPAFAVAGRKMLFEGALPFRDLLEAKPPGLFLLYGIASYFFGPSVLDFRIFDALFHLASFTILYLYLKSRFGSAAQASTAVALYSLMLIALGTDNTTQAETFALLPSLLLFIIGDLVVRNKPSTARLLALGFITGFLCIVSLSLKYTLIAPTVAMLLFVTMQRDISVKKRTAFAVSSLFSIAALIGVIMIVLDSLEVLEYARINLQYLLDYTAVNHPISFNSIHVHTYSAFASELLIALSPTVFILAVVGIYQASRERSKLQIHILLQLAAGLATILLERRNFLYHFARVFWVIVPFASIGAAAGMRLITLYWMKSDRKRLVKRCTIVGALMLLLIFSPIGASIVNGFRISYLTAVNGVRSVEVQAIVGNIDYNRSAVELSDSLASKLNPEDKVFIFGANIVPYLFLDRLPPTPQLLSYQLQGKYVPKEWKQLVMNDLRRLPPRFIVIESGDFINFITNSGMDSYATFVIWDELFNFVLDNYTSTSVIGSYEVYERNETAL